MGPLRQPGLPLQSIALQPLAQVNRQDRHSPRPPPIPWSRPFHSERVSQIQDVRDCAEAGRLDDFEPDFAQELPRSQERVFTRGARTRSSSAASRGYRSRCITAQRIKSGRACVPVLDSIVAARLRTPAIGATRVGGPASRPGSPSLLGLFEDTQDSWNWKSIGATQ